MSRHNRDKRKAKQALPQYQIARGSFIAQASDQSSASVHVYPDVLPHSIEPAVIEAANLKLMSIPIDSLVGVNSLPSNSRPPAYAPNPLFVGRENELHTIAAQFKQPTHTTVILTAMGGMGKTQLAIEFVHRYGCYFAGGIFWLNFADPGTISLEIAACSTAMQTELRSDFHTFPLEQQVKQIRAAWQSDFPRLLIFDNCENAVLLAQWRPPMGGCRILVTSRHSGTWPKELGVTILPLYELPRQESIALLAKHRPDFSSSNLDAIAQEVGDLPLALHLAGSYLEVYQDSHLGQPDAYLAALRTGVPLDHPSFRGEDILYDTGHTRHLVRTFALSYERLNAKDPIDQAALTLFACITRFAPGEPMPSDLLQAVVMMMKVDAEVADLLSEDMLAQFILENADQLEDLSVRTLQRLSTLGLLEKYPEKAYRMHRMLHSFACQQEAAHNPQVQMTVELVTLFHSQVVAETRNFGEAHLLLPHLRTIIQQTLPREDMRTFGLRSQLAGFLHRTGAYQEAERLYKEALTIGERVLDKNNLNLARGFNNLAELYREQGRYEEAEPLMQKALTIYELTKHPDRALSFNSLAGLYQALGDYKKAEQLCWEALKITEQVLGEECAETANILNSLGFLCGVQKKYKEAESLLKLSLGIWERIQGKEHSDTARTLHNLAKLFCEQRRYLEAEPLMQKTLGIWRRVLGVAHPEVARALENLAVLYLEQGQYERAEPLIQEALAIREQMLGKQHPETAQSLNTLATLYSRLSRYQEAEQLYKKALSICQQKLGERHPDTITIKGNYTRVVPLAKAQQQDGKMS